MQTDEAELVSKAQTGMLVTTRPHSLQIFSTQASTVNQILA